MDKIEELLTRGVENIIPSKDQLEKVLRSGKKLNIYNGIDPTATRVHIGHAVSLRKLQNLVELGRNVTFLIGDFTALVGDSSDKESERPILSEEEIKKNFQAYRQQAGKILDFSKVKVVHNSEWLEKLGFKDVIQLCRHFSASDFMSRELVRKRIESGGNIRLDEVLYPVMQGYDSYFMDTDLQIGGTDQTFNMQAGRILQRDLRNKLSFVMTISFLEGTDGRKMSKSWGNAIWIEDEPGEMFGKVMSLKDSLITQYFTLATNLPMEKVSEVEERLKSGENPMVLKKELAVQIVSELHSPDEAQKAQEEFERTFQKGELATADIPTFPVSSLPTNPIDSATLILLCIGVSRSEAKRLLEQKALEINGKTITDEVSPIEIKAGDTARIGKKKFVKFV